MQAVVGTGGERIEERSAVGSAASADREVRFDELYIRSPNAWRIAISVAYVIAAIAFVLYTPPWQTPDEPAHYNYIAYIAETGALPVLHAGDYDQSYLTLLIQRRFPPMLSTGSLRYESYQPPLYYLSAAPIYWATGGSLMALRFFGVALGLLSLHLLHASLRLVFPHKHLIGLTAMAFAALLPMQVAATAAVNNDSLAKLLLLAATLVFLRWMQIFYIFGSRRERPQRRKLLLLGILLGLGMLTKIYAYLVTPLFLMGLLLLIWLPPRFLGTRSPRAVIEGRLGITLRSLAYVMLPAVLLGLPMWLRNMRLYGARDILALAWHDTVVVGQLRTVELIDRIGWIAYGEQALDHTFKSFWGVFGWMGVFMDERIYMAMLVFSGILFLGLLWAIVRLILGTPDADMSRFQLAVLSLMGLMVLLVSAAYIAYNYKFVQHQGRYFLWALLPLSTFIALAWREVLHPIQGAATGFMGAVLTVSLTVSGRLAGNLDKWTILILGSATIVLLLQPLLLSNSGYIILGWMPASVRRFLARPNPMRLFAVLRTAGWALPFVLLFLLNLLIPALYLLPQLRG